MFKPEERSSLVLEVFASYLELMRELQSTYWLEPAGSKGAWGLDDYQYLVFLWGAAQMIGADIPTADAVKKEVVQKYEDDFIYLAAIAFIFKVSLDLEVGRR